jgi:hypothetical protein
MTGLIVVVSAWRHATFVDHGERIRDGLLETAEGWAADDIALWHGGAPGGDTIAHVIAARLGWGCRRPFVADWQTYGRECGTTQLEHAAAEGRARWCPGVGRCPRAGPRRNDDMVAAAVAALADGGAAQVRMAAFPGPTSAGTRHCMGAATRAGIPVRPYPLAAPVNTQIKETTS